MDLAGSHRTGPVVNFGDTPHTRPAGLVQCRGILGNSPGQRGLLQVGPVARKMLLYWPSGPKNRPNY